MVFGERQSDQWHASASTASTASTAPTIGTVGFHRRSRAGTKAGVGGRVGRDREFVRLVGLAVRLVG